jgi:small GTP-binding protein
MSIKNYKIVILGNTGVGKTSILSRAITNTFYEFQEPTIGAAFQVKTVDISKKNKKNIIKLEIWDTAGQERYRSLAPMYYRGAYVAVICYDVNCIDSFNGAKMWSKEIEEHASESCIRIFVGNKFDNANENDIKVFNDKEWFEKNNLINIKTSAKTNYNINELFELIAKKCNKINNKKFTISPNIIIKQKNVKSKCC